MGNNYWNIKNDDRSVTQQGFQSLDASKFDYK